MAITTGSVANAKLRAKFLLAYIVLGITIIPFSYLYWTLGDNAVKGIWWIIKKPLLSYFFKSDVKTFIYIHSHYPREQWPAELNFYLNWDAFWSGFMDWTIGAIVLFVAIRITIWYFASGDSTEHLRGAKIGTPSAVNKALAKDKSNRKSRINIGGVNIPFNMEVCNFLCIGAPGSGKSQTMFQIADTLVSKSNDLLICVDPEAQFLKRYAGMQRPSGQAMQATILNPFDPRGQAWSPFAEIRSAADIPAIAKSIIPVSSDSNTEGWYSKARVVLEGAMERLWERGQATNGALYNILMLAPVADLHKLLEGHPAAKNCDPNTEQPWASIVGILSQHLSPYRYLDPDAGQHSFSIRRWINSQQQSHGTRAALFLTYAIDQRVAIAEIIGSQLDIVANTVLSQPVDHAGAKRIWLFADELPLLGKVSSLIEFVTNGRKFGGALVTAFQDTTQLRKKMGKEDAATFLSCLQTWFVYRTTEADSMEYMSRAIGKAEVRETHVSHSSSDSTESSQDKEKTLILPSEFKTLGKMEVFIAIAGVPVTKVKLKFVPQIKAKIRGLLTPAEAAEYKAKAKAKTQAQAAPTQETKAETKMEAQAEPSVQEQAQAIRAALANPGKRKAETAPAPAAAAVVEAVEIPELPADMPADIPLDMPDDFPDDLDDLPTDPGDLGDPGDLDGDLPL